MESRPKSIKFAQTLGQDSFKQTCSGLSAGPSYQRLLKFAIVWLMLNEFSGQNMGPPRPIPRLAYLASAETDLIPSERRKESGWWNTSCISSYDTDHIHHAAIHASSDKDKEANDSVGKAMVDGACLFVCGSRSVSTLSHFSNMLKFRICNPFLVT